MVGNAVVAFVGALLMAQAWQPSDVKHVIPILNVTAPTFPQAVVLSIAAFLAILSFALALASAIPPLRPWAIHQVSPFSQLLEILMWLASLMSLLSALAEISFDHWWAEVLSLNGLALWFFLSVRMVLGPLIPPAQSLVRYLRGLVLKGWHRFVVSRRRTGDADDSRGQVVGAPVCPCLIELPLHLGSLVSSEGSR